MKPEDPSQLHPALHTFPHSFPKIFLLGFPTKTLHVFLISPMRAKRPVNKINIISWSNLMVVSQIRH
jgi:hypothetical protein